MCSLCDWGQADFLRERVEGAAVLEGAADGVRGLVDFGLAFFAAGLVLGGLPGSAGALRPDCKACN
jgi:hypothetical protein